MSAAPRRVFDFRAGWSAGDPERADVLGGKGASLAAMSRAGFPVPPGFTISAECCEHAERRGEWPAGLREEVREAVRRLEEATGREFGRGPRPLLVAVRSGAAASMPGMMDTILDVGLHPDLLATAPDPERFWRDFAEFVRMFSASVAGLAPDDPPADASHESAESRARRRLERWRAATGRPFPCDPREQLDAAIGAVFASWNSARAKAFRQRNDVRGVAGTAVNVQAMFPSERSGVLFTAHPHDPNRDEMLVEASWGLGEAVVSGAVTPDIYVLDAATGAVREAIPGARPGAEPALSVEQLAELAQLGRDVDRHFRTPSDVEWGWAEGCFALLQARPIRGLDVLRETPVARAAEIERLRTMAGAERVVWVEHNLAETLPHPTPLTWDLVRWFMSGEGGYGRLYRMLGFRPARDVHRDGFLELIAGRIYVDPRRAARFYFGSLPFRYEVDQLLADPRTVEAPPKSLDLDRADSFLFARLPWLAWRSWSATRATRRLHKESPARFEEFVRTELAAYLADVERRPLTSLDDAALVAELERRAAWVLGPLAAESLLPGYFGGLALARLEARLARWLGEVDGPRLAAELTVGLEGDVTVEQNLSLERVSRGEQSWERFLAEFGHRGAREMELAEPRWSEDSTFLQQALERLRARRGPAPSDLQKRQLAVRRAAETSTAERLAAAGASSLREEVEADAAEARALLPYRETGKFHLMRGYATLRPPLLEFARRHGLGRDVFFLRRDELGEFPARAAELRATIADRRLRHEAWRRMPASLAIDSAHLDAFGLALPATAPVGEGREWPARPLAVGAATGVAVIVFDPREATELPPDAILVCPSTDPGWTPLLVGVRGLIVERGGVLSHGAIVARDFGIPSVVLEDATRRVPAGARVELDAGRGLVRVLAEKTP